MVKNFIETHVTLMTLPSFFIIILVTLFIILWYFGTDLFDTIYNNLFDEDDGELIVVLYVSYFVAIGNVIYGTMYGFDNPANFLFGVVFGGFMALASLGLLMFGFVSSARYFRKKRGKS